MGRVIAVQAVSLDGFSAGANVRVGNEMGDHGERLHEWMFPEFREETLSTSGAVVMGRRMFDLGLEPWGEDPPFHMPVFVVTHRAGAPVVKQGGTTYHFVTGGVEPALERARAAAGDRDVAVLGGADSSASSSVPGWSTSCGSIWCPSCWATGPGCSSGWVRSSLSLSARG